MAGLSTKKQIFMKKKDEILLCGDDASSVVRCITDSCGDDASSVVRCITDSCGDDASSVVRFY